MSIKKKTGRLYTTPKIVLHGSNKKRRAYISYYVDGVRYREYNGNRLGLKIFPNRCSNEEDKARHLYVLQARFNDALRSGWTPTTDKVIVPSLGEALNEVLKDKLDSDLSADYKKNLAGVHKMFVEFVGYHTLNRLYDDLKLHRVEAFLNRFRSSERNYINRRRCLGTLFNEIIRREWGKNNLISRTSKVKAKAILHIPYSDEQLKDLLTFLKDTSPDLYLCCLLTYGCLLRPHREVRLLKRKHITLDLSQIILSGKENKSGSIPKVFVPEYVQQELKGRLEGVTDLEANLFTLSTRPLSEGYFNMRWGKLKAKMKERKLISQGQTLYSFRHTAAIRVYQKSKDPYILQQLLQHSSMTITLNYLRGLGDIGSDHLKEFMPEL